MKRGDNPGQSVEALKAATLALSAKLGKKLAALEADAGHRPGSRVGDRTASVPGREAAASSGAAAEVKDEGSQGWLYAYRRMMRRRTGV